MPLAEGPQKGRGHGLLSDVVEGEGGREKLSHRLATICPGLGKSGQPIVRANVPISPGAVGPVIAAVAAILRAARRSH